MTTPSRTLEPLPVPTGHAVLAVLPRLERALAGGAPLLPYAAGGTAPVTVTGEEDVADGTALVLGTSGSTGAPKLAMLTAAALTASAGATHEVLGGGRGAQWLLPMPAHHVAGMQVLVRSLAAGTEPVVLDLAGGFAASAFAAAAARVTGRRRYTALVPTQLVRLLADDAGRQALAAFDAVLVGGAGTPPTLLGEAREHGVAVVTTYGMSETAGGCVYGGRPLPCSRVRADGDGRLLLGGSTLAAGYLGRPDLSATAFTTGEDGIRWFRTDDVGHVDGTGRWHVDGRLDDVVTTGGLKVAPRLVEDAVAARVPGVRDVVVVGVADPEWGEAVAAVVVLGDRASVPTLADVRDALRSTLPGHALPRRLLTVDAIPVRGPGKPDRAAIRALLAAGPNGPGRGG